MLVVKSLSSAPRNNAGAFAVIAAGASHGAVCRSWRTRRASVVTAAAAARRLLWLLDAAAAAAQSCALDVQLAVRSFKSLSDSWQRLQGLLRLQNR